MDVGGELADAFARLADGALDASTLQAAESGRFPETLWHELSTLGVEDAMVSGTKGGYGLGWPDIAPLFRAFGATTLPVPMGEHMIARALLREGDIETPQGMITLATRPGPTIRCGDESASGEAAAVMWAAAADHVLIEAENQGAVRFALLACADLKSSAVPTLSREPYATLICEDAQIVRSMPGQAGRPVHLGALLRALQIAGAIERLLSMTVEYARTREQFGRPIARFQAIQQLLAEMANELAAVNAITEVAVHAVGREGGDLTIGVAKSRCSAAADRAAAIAHEVHAAIGVTEELGMHHLTRRLWQWRDDFGDQTYWAESIGRRALSPQGPGLWATILAASGGTDG